MTALFAQREVDKCADRSVRLALPTSRMEPVSPLERAIDYDRVM